MPGDDFLSFSKDSGDQSSQQSNATNFHPYHNQRRWNHQQNRNRFHDSSYQNGSEVRFSPPQFSSSPNSQQSQNPQKFHGGSRFRGKSNRQRGGFGFQNQNQNQFGRHHPGRDNFKPKLDISEYVHPSMTEDPWNMFNTLLKTHTTNIEDKSSADDINT